MLIMLLSTDSFFCIFFTYVCMYFSLNYYKYMYVHFLLLLFFYISFHKHSSSHILISPTLNFSPYFYISMSTCSNIYNSKLFCWESFNTPNHYYFNYHCKFTAQSEFVCLFVGWYLFIIV